MKTRNAIVLVLIVASVAFLCGAKTVEKLKFPYLPTEVNKEVSITQAELTCAGACFEAKKPIEIARKDKTVIASVASIEFKPQKESIRIFADVSPTPEIKITKSDMNIIFGTISKESRKMIYDARWIKKLSTKWPRDCPCVIRIAHNGKVIETRKMTF